VPTVTASELVGTQAARVVVVTVTLTSEQLLLVTAPVSQT